MWTSPSVYLDEVKQDLLDTPLSYKEFERLYLCVWTTSDEDIRRNTMLHENDTQWFINVNGQLIGPFPSKDVASAKMLSENMQGTLVPKTDDGRDILMG